ncbi:MAG TPA: DUF72 domain-containing protein [Ktedonobacteraceae bacterium]|nr:DUF72 domain-containing protein [Ktedonobacteraceae bacterium]
MFYIGCPLWGYKEWGGNFFPAHTPASDFLRLYSRRLSAVEGNTVFYALPSAATIDRWKQETPETFRICPKVSRSISHTASLENSHDETWQLIKRMKGLGTRLGPMFLQLPPAFGPTHLTQLEAYLTSWPPDVRLAVEVRHPDFYAEEHASALNSLLRQHHAGRVMMDTRPIYTGPAQEQQLLHARERKPNLPLQVEITTDFIFLRYIGHPRMEVNESFFQEWASQLAHWLRQGVTLYVFCHCPFEIHSPDICAALYQRVSELVKLPPLPWERVEDEIEPEQPRLF